MWGEGHGLSWIRKKPRITAKETNRLKKAVNRGLLSEGMQSSSHRKGKNGSYRRGADQGGGRRLWGYPESWSFLLSGPKGAGREYKRTKKRKEKKSKFGKEKTIFQLSFREEEKKGRTGSTQRGQPSWRGTGNFLRRKSRDRSQWKIARPQGSALLRSGKTSIEGGEPP